MSLTCQQYYNCSKVMTMFKVKSCTTTVPRKWGQYRPQFVTIVDHSTGFCSIWHFYHFFFEKMTNSGWIWHFIFNKSVFGMCPCLCLCLWFDFLALLWIKWRWCSKTRSLWSICPKKGKPNLKAWKQAHHQQGWKLLLKHRNQKSENREADPVEKNMVGVGWSKT